MKITFSGFNWYPKSHVVWPYIDCKSLVVERRNNICNKQNYALSVNCTSVADSSWENESLPGSSHVLRVRNGNFSATS